MPKKRGVAMADHTHLYSSLNLPLRGCQAVNAHSLFLLAMKPLTQRRNATEKHTELRTHKVLALPLEDRQCAFPGHTQHVRGESGTREISSEQGWIWGWKGQVELDEHGP